LSETNPDISLKVVIEHIYELSFIHFTHRESNVLKKLETISIESILNNLMNISKGALTNQHCAEIERRLTERLHYTPRIAIFGKTGAGKSSTLNAIFGQNLSAVSDVAACTREVLSYEIQTPRGQIILLDCPGVAESSTRDKEYAKLYHDLLTGRDGSDGVDFILWVLKGDDRAFSADLEFYERMIKPAMDQSIPILFVLNQVDKIEPFREWDEQRCTPGARQQQNIQDKRTYVSQCFSIPPSLVVPISALEGYKVGTLMYEIITRLNDHRAKISLGGSFNKLHKSDEVYQEEKSAWWEILDSVISVIPVVKTVWRGIKKLFKFW
jgi:uncharacterized protein